MGAEVPISAERPLEHDSRPPVVGEIAPAIELEGDAQCALPAAVDGKPATAIKTPAEVAPSTEADTNKKRNLEGEVPKRQPTRPNKVVKRSERILIVGVDFGTSTTKVIWQDLGDNTFEAFKWDGRSGVEESLLLPSTITLRDGAFHFGLSNSSVRDGDVWLQSIKLCVLCSQNTGICRCRNSGVKDGIARLPCLTNAIPASSLACLFLGFVFQMVENGLRERYAEDELVLIWNIGCPMDHLDRDDRRALWERMVGAAMELRSKTTNPCGVTLVEKASNLVETIAVAPRADRNFVIQPEGLASVKAFLESPHADMKTYLIVDVGAGTTEVSCFFNGRAMNEAGHPYRPCYLDDSTEPVGGGKIDQDLSKAWGCSVEDAHRRKERGENGPPGLETVNEICRQYRRTFKRVADGRKLISTSDMKFDLFVVGGGARLQTLKDELWDCKLPVSFGREQLRQLRPPDRLKGGKQLEHHFDVLANACGLASSLDWEYYAPSEVAPIAITASMPKPGANLGYIYEK